MPALNIKNEVAYNLVKELAELEGKSMTTVVIEAVRTQLEATRTSRRDGGLAERLLLLGERTAPL